MFDWKDSKSRLSSIVALSYSSGNGLKVNELASSVGQGWNLVAAGAVSRLEVGEPDDQRAHNTSNSQDISRYPAGRMYATVPIANGCPAALTKYPIYGGMNTIYTQNNVTQEDKQPDYFSFQFNGKTGMFIIDPVKGIGRSLGDTKMKISYTTADMTSNGIRTTINSFSIKDVDGLTYKFTKLALTKVLHADFCDRYLAQPLSQPTFKGGNVYYQCGFENSKLVNPYIVDSWLLTEIDDGMTGRKVIFNYDITNNINNTAGDDISYSQEGDYTIVSHKRSISQTPVLTSIVYPDGHTVNFTYGADRVDLGGDHVLSTVDIKYRNRWLSQYQLGTTYFIGNRYGTPTTAQQKLSARLCLRSIRKIGVDAKEDSPPYMFDYFLGSSAPDDVVPAPFFYAKDIWGYYNGTNSVPYNNDPNQAIPMNSSFLMLNTVFTLNNNQLRGLCFLNNTAPGQTYYNPKPKYAQNGLLRQIIYPTGGSLTYEYAQNTGAFEGETTQRTLGGVHVVKTSMADGGHSNGCSNPIVTQYNYFMDDAQTVSSLWGMETPINRTQLSSHYNSEQKKYHWRWSCFPLGCCYWKYQYPGILSELEAVSLTGLQRFMNNIAPVLGVLTVVSDVLDVVNLIFVDSGVLSWVAVIVDFIGGLVTLGITCFSGDNSKDNTYTSYHNADINGANPLPAQFKRVVIIEGTGDIGRTVQGFTSNDQYALWVPAGQNTDFSSKQRYASWAYGLPLYDSVYDVDNKMIKATYDQYSWTDQDCDTSYAWAGVHAMSLMSSASMQLMASLCPLKIKKALSVPSLKCMAYKSSSQNNDDWEKDADYTTTSIAGVLGVDNYDYYTGRVELQSSIVTNFNKDDQSKQVQIRTDFFYNTHGNYEVNHQTTTRSDGTPMSTYTTYTSDYPNTQNAGIQKMLSLNMVSQPISTYTTVQNPALGSGDFTIKETATVPVLLSNGDVKPSALLEQRFAKPTAGVTLFSPDNPNNSSIYKTIHSYYYDAGGDAIGIKDEGGRAVTSIYNYDDKYIVADVINADPVLDKPAYTSFETDDPDAFGGWVLGGSGGAVYSSTAITGSRSFQMTSQNFSAPLNTNKSYILSFWASSAVNVSAGILVKSAPTIKGLTYYEYNIPSGNDNVTVAGNAIVDELRLYPSMGRMKTSTYDPLIGITSECDENNRITYYEYDNLGRMHFVKDENANVVKMYEYNNVSKQNGCPGTYSNNEIKETFTKSNCSQGYIGGDVIYTVPAGRYTSTISQQDADAQAETDIVTNGQNFADAGQNGSCLLLYYNSTHSQTFTTQSCDESHKGGTVTYTVPANKYSSTDPNEPDQLALNEIAANGQAYANDPDHAACTLDTDPDWEWLTGAQTYCANVGGQTPAHLMVPATDVNPNSPSFNSTSWQDAGTSTQCPFAWYSQDKSGNYSSQNCSSGYTALPYYVPVAPGMFGSNVSLADANSQAIQYAQGQANQNGGCQAPSANFYVQNSSSTVISVEMDDASTGNDFFFDIPAGQPLTAFLYVPAGTYDVYLDVQDFTGILSVNYGVGCRSASGIVVEQYEFHDVPISSSCNTISISAVY